MTSTKSKFLLRSTLTFANRVQFPFERIYDQLFGGVVDLKILYKGMQMMGNYREETIHLYPNTTGVVSK